jgi:hypothetical protein
MDLAINIAESTPSLVAQRCQRLWRECEAAEAPARAMSI